MSVFVIILLILLGIVLLMVEFFVIPGITIAGIGGVLLIAGGVFSGYYFHTTTAGHYIFAVTGISMGVIFVSALKLKTWQRFGLKATVDGKMRAVDIELVRQGDVGKTVSRLAPIGKALINEKFYEVRSDGNYIDNNLNIIVTRIDGIKIFVEIKN